MSDSTKFTRGPWVSRLDSGSPPFVTRQNENSGWICQTVTWCGLDEAKANARLIAAAPDLYEAALEAQDTMMRMADRCHVLGRSEDAFRLTRSADRCLAAMKKARGETSLAQAEA
jgi:hypothetical protein